MVSSKFENKVAALDVEKLRQMQQELRERVDKGKIGFKKRAENTLGGILTGAVTNSIAEGFVHHIFGSAVKRPFIFGAIAAPLAAFVLIPKVEERLHDRGVYNFKSEIMWSAASQVIFTAMDIVSFNKKSKIKQAERLSFVDKELERREAPALQLQGHQM